jgi:hypothetical protein
VAAQETLTPATNVPANTVWAFDHDPSRQVAAFPFSPMATHSFVDAHDTE